MILKRDRRTTEITYEMRDGGANPIEGARALGAAMLTGGLLAGVSVSMPPGAEESEAAIIVIGAIAVVAGALLLGARRVPRDAWLGAVAALGTVMITAASWAGGISAGGGANEVLYIWVCLYAFYFLAVRHALAQLAIVALAYAWLLDQQGTPLEIALNQWLITITTLLVAGLLVARLRTSLRGVVSDLSQRARYDSLTGLLNRQEFEERGALELARNGRHDRELSLIAVDLDKFKELNDSHGHPAGDLVLKRLSRILDAETRRIDAVARVGGDEFLVLLPETGERDARRVAERLLTAARASGEEHEDGLRVSLGVAIAGPEAVSLLALWAAADEALYAAKRAGGDGVAIARVTRPRAADTIAAD